MSEPTPRRNYLLALLSAAGAALVAACKSGPSIDVSLPQTPVPAPLGAPESTTTVGPVAGPSGSARSSGATTPRAYREDGASHLYGLNADRIYKGKMPPLLYAIGVLDIHIDRMGIVTHIDWTRAPRHAPEVMEEIARTVQKASPFPAPTRLGKVVYTDTWLWHKSGKFQLDTLTEGQT
jgi:periplasmic protein TonB